LVALLLKRSLQKRNKKKKGTKCKKKLNHRNKPTRNYRNERNLLYVFPTVQKKEKKIVLSEKKSCALLESTYFVFAHQKKELFPSSFQSDILQEEIIFASCVFPTT
jgi:hypothetical protein